MRKNVCVLILCVVISVVCLPLSVYAVDITEDKSGTMTIIKKDLTYEMDEPADGKAPEYLSDVLTDERFTVVKESWKKKINEEYLWNYEPDETDKFQEGLEYGYVLELEANDEYIFDENIGFDILGVEWSYKYLMIEDKTLYFEAYVTIGEIEPLNIELKFDKEPKAYAILPELAEISCPVEYEIVSNQWTDSDYNILYNHKLKYDKKYYHRVIIEVSPDAFAASKIAAEVKNKDIEEINTYTIFNEETGKYEIEIRSYLCINNPVEVLYRNLSVESSEYNIGVKLVLAGVIVIIAVMISIKVYNNRRYR